jgi:hypothetical protein
MKEYAVGAILGGLLLLAVLGRRSSVVRAVPHPADGTPVLGASALAHATLTHAFDARGIPAALVEAIRRAPERVLPGADRADDVATLQLAPETAETLASRAVERVPGLTLTAADSAMAMRSGVRRVVFTAHAPAVPMSIKLVATYARDDQVPGRWDLVYLRPYSSLAEKLDPLAGADAAVAEYACFKPVVSPGPC